MSEIIPGISSYPHLQRRFEAEMEAAKRRKGCCGGGAGAIIRKYASQVRKTRQALTEARRRPGKRA